MKNFKKFTLGVMGAVLLATGLWACSNDNDAVASDNLKEQVAVASREEGNIRTFYGRIPLPEEFGNDATPNFSALIDVENEVVLEYRIDHIVADAYQIPYAELNELFRIDMGTLLTSLNGKPKDGDDGSKFTDHAGCIEACKDKYIVDGEKQKGLGSCKANCWVDTGVKVVAAIAKAFSK